LPLELEIRPIVEQLNSLPPMHTLTAKQLRDNMRHGTKPSDPAGVSAADLMMNGPTSPMHIRLYRPHDVATPGLCVFFHGGGFVMGDLETHDQMCRDIARAAQCAILSVQYRLAPEYPYPASLQDTLAATRWAADNTRALGCADVGVVVMGDSSGGNLSAATALSLRDQKEDLLIGQVLIYPVVDHYSGGWPSYRENAEGYYLTEKDMIFFWDNYLADPAQAKESLVSPLRTKNLSDLPPTMILSAEFDPLRDEAEAYAERLKESGCSVTCTRYDSVVHGFLRLANFSPTGRKAIEDIGGWLNRQFKASVAATSAEKG